MSKVEAVMNVYFESSTKRATKTGRRRMERSLRTLGLSDEDLAHCMVRWDYYDPETMKPYGHCQ